jgi:hypothetical protein
MVSNNNWWKSGPWSSDAHTLTTLRLSVLDQIQSLSPPATEETGAMGRDIESRQGIYRVVVFH